MKEQQEIERLREELRRVTEERDRLRKIVRKLDAGGLTEKQVDLFETLPERFTQKNLHRRAREVELGEGDAAAALDAFRRHEMVIVSEEGFTKTGTEPYF